MDALNPLPKMLAIELADDLDELWEKHPDGLTAAVAAAHADVPRHQADQALQWLVQMGKGKIIRRPDRQPEYFVPPDWTPPAYDLTAKQRATLEWMASRSDADGSLSASFRDVCLGANLSGGAIVAHIDALDRKHYLRIIERGNYHRKTRFQVFPNGDATGSSVWPGRTA